MSSSKVSRSPRRLMSPLHTKGIFTLGLILLAESVTVSNAVKLWSTYPENSSFTTTTTKSSPSTRKSIQECLATSDAASEGGSCSPARPPVVSRSLGRLARRVGGGKTTTLDCCSDCAHCINNIEGCNIIPRGGHVAEAAAEAAATGAAVALPYGIPLNGWKVLFQAFLTSLNVLCWLVPLRSKKISENKLALSIANAFSGGVFLSLAFGHLIPECVHGFEGYNEVTPYLLVLSGYLLIFFVEKVAFDAHGALHDMEHAQENVVVNKKANGGDAVEEKDNQGPSSGRSALILLGALAVHSILEMTALGLADTFGDSAILTLSIALHQPAESIALLVAFLKSGMPKGDIIRFLSVFSAMGPIGVALGMAVNEFAAPIVDSIMVAVVAGTFVYVGATEVIPEEWEDQEHKWKKFFALMGGIISILIITQYTATLEM